MTIGKLVCFSALFLSVSIFLFLVLNTFIKKDISKRKLIIILSILIVSISVVSFFIQGNEGHDLTRYFYYLEDLADKDFSYLFTKFKYKNSPITALWFYFVAKIGVSHLLPVLPTLVTFGCISYICINIYEKNNRKNFSNFCIAFLACFSMVEIIYLISTVRYCTAMALISVAIYRDVYQKKNGILTYLLYLIPLFIHLGSILIIFVRLFSIIKVKYLNIILLFICPILLLISKVMGAIHVGIFNDISNSISTYVGMESIDWRFVICNTLFAIFVLTIILLRYLMRLKKEGKRFTIKEFISSEFYRKEYCLINYLLTMIGLVFCSQLIRRINLTVICLAFPIIYYFMNELDEKRDDEVFCVSIKKLRKLFKICLLVIFVGMSVYQAFGFKVWTLICL